jgi:sugar lactone lactonase YvrE
MKRRIFHLLVPGLIALLTLTQCSDQLKTPILAFGKALPEKYNSPDGMTLGDDGCIYLSMNNVSNPDYPAKILRITKDDEIEEVIALTPHPVTGIASPMGIVYGSDGNMYVSDNQAFVTQEPHSSRLMRITMDHGNAVSCETVATGFNMSNGVTAFGDCIYVAETNLNAGTPHKSGVYRFHLDELNPGEPVQVTGIGDKHLISVIETNSEDHPVGANGLVFNSDGELFVCNFGDAEVIKYALDEEGSVTSHEVFAKGDGMLSADGMQIDSEDNLWIADFLGNAVVKISPEGKVTIVAKNEQTDGANGELDAPSECIVRGNKLYVSNIDLTYGPNTTDKVHSMSVINLK